MVHFASESKRLFEGVGPRGQNHELLHIETVAGVNAAVYDVEGGAGHHKLVSWFASQLCQVMV